jgi:hypothetical protein
LAAAAVLAGCGADAKTIRSGDAQQLLDELSAVRTAFDEGACTTTLPTAIESLSATVDGLPSSVGEDVQGTLDQGIARLETLAIENCEEPAPTTETTEPTTTFETVTEPPVTEETETKTEETETQETEKTVPDEEPEFEEPPEEEFLPPGQQKPKPNKPQEGFFEEDDG